MRYPVTLTKDDNETFLVRFPDVPEAVTFGNTKEEALDRAVDALLTIFDAFMKDRRDIPAPSVRHGLSIEIPALETTKLALYTAMRAAKIGKAELARRLDWHLPQVDRVLNVKHGSQLDQIAAALSALGKRLTVSIVDDVAQAPSSAAWRRRTPVHGAILVAARAGRFERVTASTASTRRVLKRAAKKK